MAINPITGLDEDEMNNDVDQMPNLLASAQNTTNLNSPPKRSDDDDYAGQIKSLLQKLGSQQGVSPQAQEASNLRRLLGGMMSQPAARQFDFVHGGYIDDKAQDLADENRMKNAEKWVQEPIQREKDQRENLKDLLQAYGQAENIKSQVASRGYLNQQRQEAREKNILERSKNLPNSDISAQARPSTKSELKGYVDMLNSFGKKGKEQGQIQGYLSTADNLQSLVNGIDGMSLNQQKEALDKAKQMVSAATGLRDKELDRMMVAINAGRAAETGRHNQATEANAANRIAQNQAKLQHSISNMKLDAQANKKLQEMDNQFNTIKGLGEISDIAAENGHTGLVKKIEVALQKPFGEMSAEDRKLIAKIAFVYQPYRKQQFGVPSAGDEKIVQQYFPDIKENPESFLSAVKEFELQNRRNLSSNMSSFVATHTADLGVDPQDVTEENAYKLFIPLKGNLSKAYKGGQAEKIPLTTTDQSNVQKSTNGRINVRRKSDGKMGNIPADKFDPSIYERM